MATILKYLGKGQWAEINESEITPEDKLQKAKQVKLTDKEKLNLFFEALTKDIIKSGYRTTKISSILKAFGITKRSSKNVLQITEELKRQGYYTLPEYSNELKLDSTIRIYNYPVRQLGDLFTSEKALEDFVDKHHCYKQLFVSIVLREARIGLTLKGSQKMMTLLYWS